jgi:hypothetical protein
LKFLSPKVHGMLDYATVLVFIGAPSLIGMVGIAAKLSYALAAIHLALTLLTDFPCGAFQAIPLSIHGWVELAVVPTIIATPWIFRFGTHARAFYIAAGAAIFIIWSVTDYGASSH